MAEVRVTKQFKENFDLWAADVIACGDWTQEEMDEFKVLMRQYELADGPDRLRDTLVAYTPEGKEIPVAINDPKERYRHWDEYFAGRANDIRLRQRNAFGVMRKAA